MIPACLTLTDDERRLLDRAACWPGADLADLTAPALQEVAAAEGLDFATALIYDRLRRAPRNRTFIDHLETLGLDVGQASLPAKESQARMPAPHRGDAGVSIAIVPGAFHREQPASGADGRLIRAAAAGAGVPSTMLPLPSFAPPTECGQAICAALLAQNAPSVVLVSLSKGGTDVRAALERPEAEEAFARVAAWVSVSGIIYGTPLVAWLRRRPLRSLVIRALFRLRGYSWTALGALDRVPDGAPPLRLPPHVRVIHIAGFPLRRHINNRLLGRGHRRLAPLGPNDGVALLADMARLPGVVFPIWGADHYLRVGGRDLCGLFGRVIALVSAGKEPHENPAALAGR